MRPSFDRVATKAASIDASAVVDLYHVEQFVRDRVVTKAASIDASAVVDLYHVQQYGETQVLAFLDQGPGPAAGVRDGQHKLVVTLAHHEFLKCWEIFHF